MRAVQNVSDLLITKTQHTSTVSAKSLLQQHAYYIKVKCNFRMVPLGFGCYKFYKLIIYKTQEVPQ